jgi:hypothetical protein
MKTKLCHLLGIEYPIMAAPMGPDLTGPDLVAAAWTMSWTLGPQYPCLKTTCRPAVSRFSR